MVCPLSYTVQFHTQIQNFHPFISPKAKRLICDWLPPLLQRHIRRATANRYPSHNFSTPTSNPLQTHLVSTMVQNMGSSFKALVKDRVDTYGKIAPAAAMFYNHNGGTGLRIEAPTLTLQFVDSLPFGRGKFNCNSIA